MEAAKKGGSGVPCSEGEPGTASRADRVKEAIRALGTARDAARVSGVPYGTLQNYAQGGEMKLTNAAALARAAGVRLEWLATGDGPMRPGQAPAGSIPEPSRGMAEARVSSHAAELGAGVGLAWSVNPDRIARAYELALRGLVATPGRAPDARRLMQITLLLYDDMTEAEEAAPKPPPGAP